ncbi:MAG: LemA family protein [Ferruginibacter sp.]|nr:LemA family protein [Chitinophagaceae bacterium]
MNKKRYSGYIIGGLLVVVGIFLITTYNSLVKKEVRMQTQWSEVQNAYQRRLDLIPNLINVVKGAADFEQNILTEIAAARSKAQSVNIDSANIDASKFQEQNAAQNGLANVSNRIIITIEKYPQLKGTEAFLALQTDLLGTERRIKVARKDFNEAVRAYNSSVRSFPTSLVAGIFGFKAKDGFTADSGTDKATEIKF